MISVRGFYDNKFAVTVTWISMILVFYVFMGVGLVETGILLVATTILIKTVSKMKYTMRLVGYGALTTFYGFMLIAIMQEGILWLTPLTQ